MFIIAEALTWIVKTQLDASEAQVAKIYQLIWKIYICFIVVVPDAQNLTSWNEIDFALELVNDL